MHLLVNRDGHHLGPYTFDQACQLLAEGKLHSWDLCWPDGAREWVTLETVDGLADKAMALREQRRSEAASAAQAAAAAGPSAPVPAFVTTQPKAAEPDKKTTGRQWMRITVWSSLMVVIVAAVVVWVKFISSEVLIEKLVHRADNLTYVEGEQNPFTGTAYSYFPGSDILWEEINFTEGRRDGKRTVWHINGNLALEEIYETGTLQSAKSFDFNGIASATYQGGTGTVMLYWNTTGSRAQEIHYEHYKILGRSIWDQEGTELQRYPPEAAVLPPPPEEIEQAAAPDSSITNTIVTLPPPTNNVTPVVNTQPDPNIFGRTRRWVVGNPNDVSRVRIDRRIDLIFANKQTNEIVKVFGYPDRVHTHTNSPVIDWEYTSMKVFNIAAGGNFNTVYFRLYNGYVFKIQPVYRHPAPMIIEPPPEQE